MDPLFIQGSVPTAITTQAINSIVCVAMCILVNSKLTTQYGNYAHQLLQHFVSKCAELYGREFLVYNVHTLAHIAREAQHFGDLDSGASEI